MEKNPLTLIGTQLVRSDASEKVLGAAKYVDDLHFSDTVYLAIRTAEVASGALRSIDISKARGSDGVLAVLTHADIPGENQMGSPVPDYPILLKPGDEIRYVGDYVAFVVAHTREQALRAAEKVTVMVAEKKPVLSLNERIRELQKGGDYVPAVHQKIRKGDSDPKTMFDSCDYVFEGDFFADYQEHAYLETQGMIALYDQDNVMTIYGSMQCPYYVQNGVARALGFPINRIRIIQSVTGGAFGGKEEVPTYFAIPAALAAYHLHRPVKLVLSREEDIQWTSKRHPIKSRYKVGIADYGRLRSIQVEAHADIGGHSTLSPTVLWRSSVHAAGAYEIPNVRVDVYGHYTNKVPSGAYRGFGSPQVFIGIEGIIDDVADHLKKDRLYLRKINALEKGKTTPTGHLLPESVGAKKTLEEVERLSDWERLKERVAQFNREHKHLKRGVGIAHIHYGVALGAMGHALDASGAFVNVLPDGSISVHIGGTEMGQGAKTVIGAIVGEVLQQPMEKIHVYQTDTFFLPDSGPTVASRTTVFSGNAAVLACQELLKTLTALYSTEMAVPPQSVRYTGGVFSNTEGQKPVGFGELAGIALKKNIGLCATGWFQTPRLTWDPENGFGEAYVTYSFASQIVVVEVDCLTAEVVVKEVYTAHDVGKALNPDGVIGQIHGGFVQGMGYALYENLKVNEKGKIVSDNFNTLTIPTIHETPEIFKVSIVEEPFSKGPFGAKGIGEPSLIPTPAAIANAVSDAIGKRVREIPIRKEYLLDLIRTAP
ncbi:MAG TPA: xanthine dehydrogenase family protein molybdopterin-binding subunit [Thermotogota bacterium]|nr:xanthine dehydrogenase family protein [Thermotogota bacterium]NLH19966.1 xanthine dehydrogenase family protein [Thermotogaceae bacterium]HNW46831.1 xanthine dehydrogenase family protein molybdopterin-binding subunit [Thermotogota bacterium]HOF22441.1 xanthine dehydrogenase family protein molybdopterin-binding subunit [Thermotogota bacterium]HOH12068.1 xanthine dehydrogenase family protein molybdopterin-binding subunit [Thermotogota bacterium]